jgi:transposase InsO family protein
MKKEEIRKEFFKLRSKGHSYSQSKKLLGFLFEFKVSIRTLKRWEKKLRTGKWNLKDKSRKPKKIHYKVTNEQKRTVINLKKKTGWGEHKISEFVKLSHTTINKILKKNKLTNLSHRKKKRIKYIRWQRKHPNSLWQMDLSDQKIKDKYCFAVIDDCSRYCIGLIDLKKISTEIICRALDNLIATHGKPREILTDNGNVFGERSVKSRFDKWCRRRGIKHIRTAIHSPTTTGKVERFFQTLARELEHCIDHNDFRRRYNHLRPHTSLEGKTPSSVYFNFSKLFGW